MLNYDYEYRFIKLVREITGLQWVRESLSSHSKFYEGAKRKLEKQARLKSLSEKELIAYQSAHDSSESLSGQNKIFNGKSYSDIIESIRHYDMAIDYLRMEIHQAQEMLDDLNPEKIKLDYLCIDLHDLYDQIMAKDLSDPNYVFGQQLRRHKNELASEIPDIKVKIERYQGAQSKLNIAIDHIKCAMRSLPGAKIIMDKQAITKDFNKLSIILGKQTLKPDAIENANRLIAFANDMIKEAARLCPRDAYMIDFSLDSTSEQDMVKVLTQCRDHRIKVENMLRTMINPRLHIYRGQMTTAKVHYEQRVMACVDHEVVTLEAVLRVNGCLRDESLDGEISRLRMGTRAAMAAVVSESSERVTVDDVLEISVAEGRLPEYASVEPHHNSDSSSSSHTDDELHEFLNASNQVPTNISCELPSYHTMEQPPSYYASTQ